MKKISMTLFILLLSAMMLAGCGNKNKTDETVIESVTTIGDAMALDAEETQMGFYEDVAVYVFSFDGTYYRAKANLPPEVSDALWELDILAEDYEEKRDALLASLEIGTIENLNDQILDRNDMDALVGKTGETLLESGWHCTGYNLETMEFWMNYGPFCYTVVFNGSVSEEEYADFDDTEDIKDLTIKSVAFYALGDATDIE